jgi:RHS repeat-associated protein
VQYDEETGLYYLRARYYDPAIGRFIQEDPVGLAGGSNVYAYLGGDPTRARDPMGTMGLYDKQYADREVLIPGWSDFSSGGDDWDGDGVSDTEEWAEFSWALVGIKARFKHQGVATSFSMLAYYKTIGAANSLHWGAARTDLGERVIRSLLFWRDLVVGGTFDLGDVDTSSGKIYINAGFVTAAEDAERSFEQLRLTLAHELFHWAWVQVGVSDQQGEIGEIYAECFALRMTGIKGEGIYNSQACGGLPKPPWAR